MTLVAYALAVAVIALAGIGIGLALARRLDRWAARTGEDDGSTADVERGPAAATGTGPTATRPADENGDDDGGGGDDG